MATPSDIARRIKQMSHKIAAKVHDAPTGIPPGYDPATGITWLENGKARGRGVGKRALAIYKINGGFNVTHTTATVDFADMLYDPEGMVTTGASWAFTATRADFYEVKVALSLETQAGWGTGFNSSATLFAVFENTSTLGNASGTLWLDHQYPRDGDNNIQVFLHGSEIGYLDVGDTLYVQAVQESLTTPLVASAARSRISILRV